MVMDVDDLKQLVSESGLNFQELTEEKLHVVHRTEIYKNTDGESVLAFIIELAQEGTILRLHCPMALNASSGDTEAYLAACMEVQARTLLVKFEYDDDDGEICPSIELPIGEDGLVTVQQFRRCMGVMLVIIDKNWDALETARETGNISVN